MNDESKPLSAFETYRRLVGELPSGIGGSVELVAGQLPEQTARLLRLAAIPHSFNMGVAAALMPDVEPDALKAALDELSSLSFVITSDGDGALHDSVRAYLFSQWLQAHDRDREKWDQFTAVSARLADAYAVLGAEAVGEAKAVTERQRVFHLIGADLRRGFDDFQRLCRAERYRYRLESCEALIELVREYQPILPADMQAWLDYHQAKLLIDLKRHEEARGILEPLQERSSVSADPALYARCLYRLAGVHREAREFEEARAIYLRLRSYASTNAEARDQELRAMQGLGSLLIAIGCADEAEQIVDSVLRLGGENQDRPVVAMAWNTMGIIHRKLGRPIRALEAFANALQELEAGGEVYRQRQVYNNIGLLHADAAEWEKARENLERSRDIAKRAGDTDGEATALSNLGRVYIALSRHGEAAAGAERAIQLFSSIHNWYGAATTSRGVARYYRRAGRIAEARAAFIRARELYLRAKSGDLSKEVDREIAELEAKAPNWAWWLLLPLAAVIVAAILFAYMFADF